MRSFTALVNPISGGGVAPRRWQQLADLVAAAGAKVTVERTKSREHAVRAATEAATRGDVVVAVGGDGLVRDAAEGVACAGGTLAIVPAGRGNDLARKLALPSEPAALAELLLDGLARPVDVLDSGGAMVVGNIYAGIDSVSTAMINNSRWIPAPLLYRLAPVVAVLTWRPPIYTIIADGERITAKAHMVVVANSGAYGHGLRIVPDAVLDDGLLDILIVGAGPKRYLGTFMRQARTGAHVDRPEVRVVRAKEVSLSANRPIPVGADGDDLGQLPRTVRLRPAALKVIAP